MRTEKGLVCCIALLLIQLVACERSKLEENAPTPTSAKMGADSAQLDSIRNDTIRHDTIRHDTIRHDTIRHDTIRHDTIRHDTIVRDSTFLDSLKARHQSARSGALDRLRTIH